MPTRRIIFSQITLDASIGILPHETTATQPIHVDAAIDVEMDCAVNDADIGSVLDYRALHEVIVNECTRGHFNLLETLTDAVASRLLEAFDQTRTVKVKITKPMAFENAAGVAIEVTKQR
jgi:dihydroneopterin aldolase